MPIKSFNFARIFWKKKTPHLIAFPESDMKDTCTIKYAQKNCIGKIELFYFTK